MEKDPQQQYQQEQHLLSYGITRESRHVLSPPSCPTLKNSAKGPRGSREQQACRFGEYRYGGKIGVKKRRGDVPSENEALLCSSVRHTKSIHLRGAPGLVGIADL